MNNESIRKNATTNEVWSANRIKELTLRKIQATAVHHEPVRGGRRLMRVAVIAAAICLTLAFTVAAIATNFFGLRELALPQPETEVVHVFELPDGSIEERPQQLITLQGFAGSPEHAAAVEWQEFLNTYDVVAAAVAADAAGDWGGVPEEYWAYGVYSLEMVAKVDEIAGKYGLSLLGEKLVFDSMEEFQKSIASGYLFTDDSIAFNGYKFTSGTFQFDGWGLIEFQFRASRKGVFDSVFLNIGSIDDYTEWNYENAFGTQLILMQSEYKSLIILETDIFFIVVNVLVGTDGDFWQESTPPFERSDLEHFADLIDFSQIK